MGDLEVDGILKDEKMFHDWNKHVMISLFTSVSRSLID